MSILKTPQKFTAPAQEHAALLKSADPMVTAMRGPASRAEILRKGRNPESEYGPAESLCSSSSGAEVPLPTDGTVLVLEVRERSQKMGRTALKSDVFGTCSNLHFGPFLGVEAGSEQTHASVTNRFYLERGLASNHGLDALEVVDGGNFSPAHGPSTELGSTGSPPDSLRYAKNGPIVIGEAVRASFLCVALICLLVTLWRLMAKTQVTQSHSCFLVNGSNLPKFSMSSVNYATYADSLPGKVLVVLARVCFPESSTTGPGRRHCRPLRSQSILEGVATSYARTVATGNSGTAGRSNPIGGTSGSRQTAHSRRNDRNPADQNSTQPHPNDAQTANGRITSRIPDTDLVHVMYWNIFHDFTLKLTSPEFQSLLRPYDIMFFAETDMLPGEEDTADVPDGFVLISLPRKPFLNNARRGGGVALLIRETFNFTVSKLTSPDILVLDMGSMWLIGAYIPPQSSRWEGWTAVEPLIKLWETVALCTRSENKHFSLLGDINCRIGSLQNSLLTVAWAIRCQRVSSDVDAKINARGRAVIRECELYGLCVLNGTSFETSTPGRFTREQSVLDYAIVSESLLPLVHKFHVEEPTIDPDDDWADHMRICLTLNASAFDQTPTAPGERRETPNFSGTEYIDKLYQQTLDAKETKDEALESLWGPIICESAPIHIYVEGVAAQGSKRDRQARVFSTVQALL